MSGNAPAAPAGAPARPPPDAATIFRTFLLLGMTGFGGPMAHLAMFRRTFVDRRGWVTAARYDGLVALAQLVPGPASSQVGFALGLEWAGWRGAVAAFTGFTLPSALLMTALGLGFATLDDPTLDAALRGLMLVAVVVVAHAVAAMARSIGRRPLPLLAAIGVGLVAAFSTSGAAVGVALLIAAAFGALLPSRVSVTRLETPWPAGQRRASRRALAALGVLLLGSVAATTSSAPPMLAVAAAHLQAGALVFGGGHVVLPLLQSGVVEPGWVSADAFASGYGAAQALPGPMFALSAYLGASAQPGAFASISAAISLAAMFLPGFVFIVAAQAHAAALGSHRRGLAALAMVNGAVLGLLATAGWALAGDVELRAIDVPVLAAALALLSVRGRSALWAVLLCVGYAVAEAAWPA